MKMFESFLNSLPSNRCLLVNDLDIPEDITLPPYIWRDPEELLMTRSDSMLSGSIEECGFRTASTDSSMPLSRALTDSEIDYGRYRRYKNCNYCDPWDHLRAALDAFPPGYLASLNSFHNSSYELAEECITQERVRRYNEELRLMMERFFDEECCFFEPDDPGLLALEEALQNIDLKLLDAELDCIIPHTQFKIE